MKKTLLFLVAAVGLSTTAMAQEKVTSDIREKASEASVAPFEVMETEYTNEPEFSALGPKRSVANGIWYKRPSGTFLLTSTTYREMFVPPFTKLTWTNMYQSNPSAAVWKYGSNAQNSYDESLIVNNNLVNSYNKNVGTGAYNGPYILVEGVDTFAIIDSQLSTANPLVIAPDTIKAFLHVPTTVNYSGFTNFNYGTNQPISASRGDGTDTYLPRVFFEFYKAPAQPLYLDGIRLYARLPDGYTEPIAEGSEGVTCYVIQANNDSYGDLDAYTDTVAVIPINPTLADISEYEEGYLTTIDAYCMQEDDFGDMVKAPVVLEKSFLLAIEGFNNPGVDFTVNMSSIPLEEMYSNGGSRATLFETYWTSDGALRSRSHYYSAGNYQYNMQIRLRAMYDVISLYDDTKTEYYAPVAGGNVTDAPEGGEEDIIVQSVYEYKPEGVRVPFYQIENLPSWLSLTNVDETYYSSSYGYASILTLTAQPLPEGVAGRKVTLRFVSEKGAKSQEFTVQQGDAPTGIDTINDDAIVKSSQRGTFNLNGQRVGNDYKGIVIENGKKVIRK